MMISTHVRKDGEETRDDFAKMDLMEEFPSHKKLTDRIKKTLYYGHGYMPKTERPSLPLTEIAVELFQDASPRDLGQVDTFLASSMARKACMSPCSLMLGMIFIERLRNRNPEYLQKMSSADLFFVSMMMASKYLYDEGTDDEVFNDEWAESADMELDDLNKLERNFLSAIDWSLYVHPHQFWNKLNQMEHRIAIEKGKERGWFSYTDIEVLTRNPAFRKLAFSLMSVLGKIVLVCSVAYTAAVATLVASTMATVCLREKLPVQSITLPATLWSIRDGKVDLASSTTDLDLLPTNDENQTDVTVSDLGPSAIIGSLQREKDDGETHAKKSQAVGFSGLLTLALLQDTVYQFMNGVSDKMKTLYDKKDSTMRESDQRCNCSGTLCGYLSGNFRYPSNFSSFQGSLNAKDLRCTCGKNAAKNMKKTRPRFRENYSGVWSGNILWNKILGMTTTQQKHANNKDKGLQQDNPGHNNQACSCEKCGSCDALEEIGDPLSCMLKLQLPFSELAVGHGQTVTPMSIAS